ncbi:MAG TPA: dienelactone hydrolase family protein [Thermoanaerobaculia bacterium]|nr:dienelactone hydrolase family protein [Thermoanaerobaculia bacterium]
MFRRLTLAAALLAATALNAATVSFPSSPGNGSGYLALPAGAGRHPALIVIQEWWGLNDWVRAQADRFAKEGYVAVAPDLYRGPSTSDPEVAHELSRGLPHDRAMADLEGAFHYLAERTDVDPARIGVIGWCMGGGYALDLTVAEPRLAASVINYGHLVTDPATIARIHAPILGNFGAEDRGIPPADVRAFDQALQKAGKVSDIKIYGGAGHAFMNPNNKGGYRPEAAEDAWKRIEGFLARALRSS